MLSVERENKLKVCVQDVKEGRTESYNELLAQYENYIWSCVRKFNPMLEYTENISHEDLFQEGCIGLHEACLKYDEQKGKLGSYVPYWIRKYILEHVKRHAPKLAMKWSQITLDDIRETRVQVASLDFEITSEKGENAKSLSDVIADVNVNIESEAVGDYNLELTLQDMKSKLTDREYQVAKMLTCYDQHEIAKILGVTRQRVFTLTKRIREKLDINDYC